MTGEASLRDIKDDKIFTSNARREAGHQLGQVQAGLEPDHWKPFDDVGAGAKEIIIDLDDGWFRVMYIAKFPEAVYVPGLICSSNNYVLESDKFSLTSVLFFGEPEV